MAKGKKILFYSTLVIVAFYFLFLSLSSAKAFLTPLVTAVILALLVVPLSQKMESSFMNRTIASLVNTLLIFLVSVGFVALLSFQVKNIVSKWPQIQQTMQPKINKLRTFVLEHTPIEENHLQQSSGSGSSLPFMGPGGNPGQKAATYFSQVMGFFTDYILTFIYIFFILNYRNRFKEFLLKLFPDEQQKEVKKVIEESASVTQHYLLGRLILIGLLAVLYSIGLGISGVNNFILISILAAVLSLIPYIGNIVGFGMAMAFGYLTSGESGILIGIMITFAVAQFLESYVFEPYVVGDQVDLHPFFVILAVIIGSMVWGVAGMILSIPILAMINVVMSHVEPLHPFNYLFSKDDKD